MVAVAVALASLAAVAVVSVVAVVAVSVVVSVVVSVAVLVADVAVIEAWSVQLMEGKGTLLAVVLEKSPPGAPVAEMIERASASLVHATKVPFSRTEGRAKHCWVVGQLSDAH